jgi:hypothetical protein
MVGEKGPFSEAEKRKKKLSNCQKQKCLDCDMRQTNITFFSEASFEVFFCSFKFFSFRETNSFTITITYLITKALAPYLQ